MRASRPRPSDEAVRLQHAYKADKAFKARHAGATTASRQGYGAKATALSQGDSKGNACHSGYKQYGSRQAHKATHRL